MFTILDQDYHETLLGIVARRPSVLRSPAAEQLVAVLRADWEALDGAWKQLETVRKTSAAGEAPAADLLAWCSPQAARQIMILSDGSWPAWMRNALDHDATLLWLGRAKPKPGVWSRIFGGRGKDDDDEREAFTVATDREPAIPHFVLLDPDPAPENDSPHRIPSLIKDLTGAIVPARKKLDALEKETARPVKEQAPKPPPHILADLNRAGFRALLNAEQEWPSVLKELIGKERANLAHLEKQARPDDAKPPERGFTGKSWSPPATVLGIDGLTEEAARRQAQQVRDRIGPGAPLRLWHAELTEALEPWLRRLPEARLISLRVLDPAPDFEPEAGSVLQFGVAKHELRIELTVPGIAALMVVAGFQSIDPETEAERLLGDWKKRKKLPGVAAVLRLARAWAEIAPLRPWDEIFAGLQQPTPETLREVAGHGASVARLDENGATALADALPAILRLAPWTGRMDLARSVFLALPASGRPVLGLASVKASLENRPPGVATLGDLSHVLVLASAAGLQSPALPVVEAALRLALKFGTTEFLAEHLLAWLGVVTDMTSEEASEAATVDLTDLCQRCLGQRDHHHLTSQQVIETHLRPLLENCEAPIRLKLLEAVAEHLSDPAPGDLPHRWNPPSDLPCGPDWLQSLPAFARMAAVFGSSRWRETDLHEVRGWLGDGTLDTLPSLAPGCYYSALKLWLRGHGMGADAEELQDIASHATRHRFQEWLCHSESDQGLELAQEHGAWVRARAKLVPWGGLAREWIFLCSTCADTDGQSALDLWKQGIRIFASWGRLTSTADWLDGLGETAPWKRSSWREIVPAFIEDDAGGFPPRVIDLLVGELFADEDHSSRAAWLSRMDALTEGRPNLLRTPRVAAEIEAGAARAVAHHTPDRIFAAEQALSSLAPRLLLEQPSEYDAWRKLLPDEPVQIRLALLSALLGRAVDRRAVPRGTRDPFSQRLDAFWETLARQAFASGGDDDGLPTLLKQADTSSALSKEDLRRRAAVHLLDETERRPDHEAFVQCLRLLKVKELPEAARYLAGRAGFIERLIHWAWTQPNRRELLADLAKGMRAPLPESALLSLADQLFKNGRAAQGALDLLVELRPPLRSAWTELTKWFGSDLHRDLARTLLATPLSRLPEVWRRHVAAEYAAAAATDPQAALQLNGLLNLI